MKKKNQKDSDDFWHRNTDDADAKTEGKYDWVSRFEGNGDEDGMPALIIDSLIQNVLDICVVIPYDKYTWEGQIFILRFITCLLQMKSTIIANFSKFELWWKINLYTSP